MSIPNKTSHEKWHRLPSFHCLFIHHHFVYHSHAQRCLFFINFMISHLKLKFVCIFFCLVGWLVLFRCFCYILLSNVCLTEISSGSIDNYAERWLIKSLVCVCVCTLNLTSKCILHFHIVSNFWRNKKFINSFIWFWIQRHNKPLTVRALITMYRSLSLSLVRLRSFHVQLFSSAACLFLAIELFNFLLHFFFISLPLWFVLFRF